MNQSKVSQQSGNATKAKDKAFFLSLKVKLLLGFTLLFSVVFTLSYYWFYQFSTNRAIETIEADLLNTIDGAVQGIDSTQLSTLLETGVANADGYTSDAPEYVEIMAWLQQVNSIEPRAWPYVYVRGSGENEIIALVDLWAVNDPNRSFTFLESYVSIGQLTQGLSELTVYAPRDERQSSENDSLLKTLLSILGLSNRVGYEDEWGQWISAYTPIFDGEGTIVGAMGVDFRASYVDQVQDEILNRTSLAFGITYLTLFLLVFIISDFLTRPISKLTSFAEGIGEGNYDQDLQQLSGKRFKDEISKLAEVFEIMVGKVKKREESLKKEVVKLKIEIDEGKRQKQVDAIVDSDSFQDLKKRAQQLRNRRQPTSTVDGDKG